MGIQLNIGGQVVEVGADEQTLGREKSCDVTIDDSEISREHATVKLLPDGRAELRDLGSSNGTYVNGVRIQGSVALAGGEQVRVGQTEIGVEATPEAGGETVVSGAPSPGAGETQVAGTPTPAPGAPTEAIPAAAQQPEPPTAPQPAQPPATPPPPTPTAPQPAAQQPPQPPVPPQPPAQPPRPAAQPPQPPRPGGPGPQFGGAPPPQQRSSGGGSGKLIAAIVAAVVVLLLAGGAAYWFLIRETDEEQIEDITERALENEDESCDLISENFLDEFYGGDEDACESDAEAGEPADSVTVSSIEIDGDEATATVDIEGGDSDGSSIEASYVKEDGDWLIDNVEAPE